MSICLSNQMEPSCLRCKFTITVAGCSFLLIYFLIKQCCWNRNNTFRIFSFCISQEHILLATQKQYRPTLQYWFVIAGHVIIAVFKYDIVLAYFANTESSVMEGVGRVVVGVWRAHTVLDESDEAESSPEAPDNFRKLRSSSSLNSLRMSLRKRLPLRSIQAKSLPENTTWETTKEQSKPSAVRKFTRSARNSISGMYQVDVFSLPSFEFASVTMKLFFPSTSLAPFILSFMQRFQRTREFSREECLVATPGRDGENPENPTHFTPRRTPDRAVTPRRTPRSAARPGHTPGSRARKTPEASIRGVKTDGGRRQLVRMAALRSPFASPNTQNQRLWVL